MRIFDENFFPITSAIEFLARPDINLIKIARFLQSRYSGTACLGREGPTNYTSKKEKIEIHRFLEINAEIQKSESGDLF